MPPKIKALPHQRAIVDHLVGACPEQHGMLVAHQMGAGKTFSMLMFLRNYPHAKHVIVSPSFLHGIYEQESLKLFGTRLKEGTIIVSYDDLPALLRTSAAAFRDCVLVMDEAHYLIDMFTRLEASEVDAMYLILGTHPEKALLMTGTPVYTGVTDLRILVNIAAGKEVMPLNVTAYINKFTSPKLFNAASFGYFVSALASKFSSVLLVAATAAVSTYVVSKRSPEDNIKSVGMSLFSSEGARLKLGQDRNLFPQGPPDDVQFRQFVDEMLRPIFDWAKETEDKSVWAKARRVMLTQRGQSAAAFALVMGVVVIPTMYALSQIRILLDSHSRHHDPMFYRAIDYGKMKRVVAPYVSFFKLQHGVDGVPATSETEVTVMYDTHQTSLWTRFVYDLLTNEDVASLGILPGTEIARERMGNLAQHVTRESYVQWGRMISNTAPRGKFPAKYEQCFRNMCKAHSSGAPRRAVVYTDFSRSTQTFMAFLGSKAKTASFQFDLVRPDDTPERRAAVLQGFEQGAIDVLVIHSGMYEGISVLGALQMHILDSPVEFKNLAQVMGRVVRLHSHDSLPPNMRRVVYYHYVATFSPRFLEHITTALQATAQALGNKVAYFRELLALWKQSQTYKQKLPSLYNPTILETTTAEALTANKLRPLRNLMMKLETTLTTKMELPPLMCCPLYEDDGPDEACLQRGLAPCSAGKHGRGNR